MTSISLSDIRRRPAQAGLWWPIAVFWVGFAALAAPTLVENFHQSWSSEQGQAGPLVLGLGLWLLWRRWPDMRGAAAPASGWRVAGVASLAALAYVIGRVADQFIIESYALYALGMVAIYALLGSRSLAQGWFPLAYLLFALPVPYTVTWTLTSHLRLWVTEAAVATYQAFGFNIVRDGLNILVDQYELAVKEACSGMNSLISLSAIGLLYINIRRAPPWWYYAIMIAPIVALAVFGNFVRVLVLIALTHYFGDAVAQSYLHETAGLVTFLVALLSVIGFDAVAAPALINRTVKAK